MVPRACSGGLAGAGVRGTLRGGVPAVARDLPVGDCSRRTAARGGTVVRLDRDGDLGLEQEDMRGDHLICFLHVCLQGDKYV